MSNNAARKMKRRLIQRALDSKVVGKIDVVAPPMAAPPNHPPAMKRLRLPMSDEQMALLTAGQANISAAQSEVQTLVRVIMAQHHILEGQVLEVVAGKPPKLVVLVPKPTEPKNRKKRGKRAD